MNQNRLLPVARTTRALVGVATANPYTRREWVFISKATWPFGEWDTEPDKVQWIDGATGFDCMLRRSEHSGAWCGYVGVPEGHPAFGRKDEELEVDVHGGVTFTDTCHEPTREQYAARGAPLTNAEALAEAIVHPLGDAAAAVQRAREQWRMTFDEWVADEMGRRICHVPAAGRPDRIWWVGWDAAHAYDLMPGYAALFRRLGMPVLTRTPEEVYRDQAYCEAECRQLAVQLQALAQ